MSTAVQFPLPGKQKQIFSALIIRETWTNRYFQPVRIYHPRENFFRESVPGLRFQKIPEITQSVNMLEIVNDSV